jgi:hypothetical protein
LPAATDEFDDEEGAPWDPAPASLGTAVLVGAAEAAWPKIFDMMVPNTLIGASVIDAFQPRTGNSNFGPERYTGS